MKSFNLKLTAMMAALVLAGCSTTKPPEQVAVDTPAQYREAAALDGSWKVAQPADAADRGAWWSVFGDAELSKLITDATQSSPTLVMALAHVKEA
ncbi:MAG TPA: RND transporter, partial [Collimonas sp.]|nr:RND transporter [Collimonas sp.]